MVNDEEISTIERAFELARDGSCRTIVDIEKRLERERYDAVKQQLSGASIRNQLRENLKFTFNMKL